MCTFQVTEVVQTRGGSVSVIKVGFGYRLFFGYFKNLVGFSVSVNEKTDIFGYFSVIAKL